ncbi:MAG: hypothetical protein M1816_007152 [Peltula sp. TS41687]|nr:MAG: hypothetical protein M1816_007152 [Peltula sp. TS41687]
MLRTSSDIMDAKPQRLGRALRSRTNENDPAQPKVLHQRFKSTGALAMSSTAAFKGGAHRMAFGDVSNISRNLSRDDSGIGGKKAEVTVEKSSELQRESGPGAALLRPAQRPQLQPIGSQASLNSATITTNKLVTAPPKPSLLPTSQQAAAPSLISQKPATKRDTAVFKDSHPVETGLALEPVVEEASPAMPERSAIEAVPHEQEAQAKPTVLPDDVKPLAEKEKTRAELTTADINATVVETRSSENAVAGRLLESRVEIGTVDQALPRPELIQTSQTLPTSIETTEISPQEQGREILRQILQERELHPEDNQLQTLNGNGLQHILEGNEVEEYWLVEEDENYEDDDGYTTARSFRSRGENTTGGPTMVLFPKVNSRIRRELATAKQIVEMTRSVEEIEEESWDTTLVAEYGDEIFDYMRELEIKMLPNAHYMDIQTEIQWSMRSILMDWLVQVHHRLGLLPETLFLAVNYIDRFLSFKIVSLGKLQLVGATALLIASKYEEINCPTLQEIVYMVDGGYTMDEILKAERYMLSMLQFELGFPGPMSFLRRISKADDYDLETRTLAKYFLEVTVMDERFVASPPSFLAAGAHCLARLMLKKGTWSYAHIYYSNYTFSQLRQLLLTILDCCENPRVHHVAVYDKYIDRRFKRASVFVEAEMTRGFRLPETSAPSTTVVPAAFVETQNSVYRSEIPIAG